MRPRPRARDVQMFDSRQGLEIDAMAASFQSQRQFIAVRQCADETVAELEQDRPSKCTVVERVPLDLSSRYAVDPLTVVSNERGAADRRLGIGVMEARYDGRPRSIESRSALGEVRCGNECVSPMKISGPWCANADSAGNRQWHDGRNLDDRIPANSSRWASAGLTASADVVTSTISS